MEKVFQFIKQFSHKNLIHISLNWATVLTFVSFWMYGVYGFFTVPRFTLTIQIIVSVLLLAVFIYTYSLQRFSSFIEKITITGKDVLVFGSYTVLLFLLAWKALYRDIDGDQLYHAQQAMMHALFGTQFLSSHVGSVLSNVPFVYVMWGINVLLALVILFGYWLVKKWKSTYTLVFLSIVFLLTRFSIVYEGGNGSAFPAFRLFPLWITGTLFSPSSFSFRLATFIGLLVLMFFVYRYVSKKFSFVYAFTFGLFVGTIPVLLHVGTLVEMSLWASFCLVIVLFTINTWCEGGKVNYVGTISLVVTLSCMRVSPFITLIPIVGMILLDFIQNKLSKKEAVVTLSPVLVLLPVILASIYIGTPATYHGLVSLDPYVPAGTHLLGRLYIALTSGAFLMHIYNSVYYPLMGILFVLPLLLLRNMKKFFLVTGLFVLYFILFYSIEPGLWGNGRYQAEYIVPFIVYGMYLIACLIREKYTIALLLLCIGIASNIFLYTHSSELNKASYGQDVYFSAMKNKGEYFVWSELPYNFKDALQQAKKESLAGATYYSPGNGYGYFSEILSGYTVDEMQKQKSIISRIGVGISSSTANTINLDNDVHLVLVNGSRNNKDTLNEKMILQLQKHSWGLWKEFKNEEYQTILSGYIRLK